MEALEKEDLPTALQEVGIFSNLQSRYFLLPREISFARLKLYFTFDKSFRFYKKLFYERRRGYIEKQYIFLFLQKNYI